MSSLAAIEILLNRKIGMDALSLGSTGIERSVKQRLKACGLGGLDDYYELLGKSELELQELIEAVIVSETWFFRHPESFEALKTFLFAERPASRNGSPLRVLSMPCATGEEPYSIAMTLMDCGMGSDSFRIDAIDISPSSLRRALAGIYGNNSFRGANLAFRERFFEPFQKKFRISERLRKAIRFQHANILDDSFWLERPRYDVIFCRNLLIYFDAQTQTRAVRLLHSGLRDDGLLFVGPAEQALVAQEAFLSMKFSSAFAYRKQMQAEGTSLSSPKLKPGVPKVEPARAKLAALPKTKNYFAGLVTKPSPATTRADSESQLDKATRLADQGELLQAAELCEKELKIHGASPRALYLLGLVRDASGDTAGASDFYRKALYLNPNYYDALMHLSFLKEKEGDVSQAENLKARARKAEQSAIPHPHKT